MFRFLISYHIGSPELKSKTRKYIDINSSLFYINNKKHGQSRETGNTEYIRRRKTQPIMCWTPLYAEKHK